MGLSTTRFDTAPYRADFVNFKIFGATFPHGTVYAPKQQLYQKEAPEMESLKM